MLGSLSVTLPSAQARADVVRTTAVEAAQRRPECPHHDGGKAFSDRMALVKGHANEAGEFERPNIVRASQASGKAADPGLGVSAKRTDRRGLGHHVRDGQPPSRAQDAVGLPEDGLLVR